MKNFKEIPASKRSLSKRKPVCGLGINDADYLTSAKVGGRVMACPYYRAWTSMLARCYSASYQARRPTYIGCSVTNEWLTFSAFKAWMKTQRWQGSALDKDLLIEGNKVYAPDTCVFVDRNTNNLLGDSGAIRGKYPQGVNFDKRGRRFVAHIKLKGESKHIGSYGSPEEAEGGYREAKSNEIERTAYLQDDFRVAKALITRANNMRDGL